MSKSPSVRIKLESHWFRKGHPEIKARVVSINQYQHQIGVLYEKSVNLNITWYSTEQFLVLFENATIDSDSVTEEQV